jgi:hypothetical protein
MRNKWHLIIFLLLLVVLVSCNNQDNLLIQVDGYPIEGILSNEPSSLYEISESYPIEDSWLEQEDFYVSEIVIPSPLKDLGVVHGSLVTLDANLPYLAPSLYLGQVHRPDDSENALIISSISIEEDPIAVQAVNGDFIFINIPPGEYGLFIWTPMSVFLVEDAKTGEPVFITVETDEIVDIGTIFVP